MADTVRASGWGCGVARLRYGGTKPRRSSVNTHDRETSPTRGREGIGAQISLFGAAPTASQWTEAGAHIGGYLRTRRWPAPGTPRGLISGPASGRIAAYMPQAPAPLAPRARR